MTVMRLIGDVIMVYCQLPRWKKELVIPVYELDCTGGVKYSYISRDKIVNAT